MSIFPLYTPASIPARRPTIRLVLLLATAPVSIAHLKREASEKK